MTRKMTKKWLCLIFIVTAMMGIFPIAVKAQQQRVYDQAALLTAEEVQQLEQEIAELQSKTNYDFAVVTTDDAEGKTARDYADDFYDTNHFGMGSEESGALLLIDMDNREIWISTAGEMIDILNDARIEMILDDVFEEVVNEDYAKAADAFLQKTEAYIEQGVVEGQYRETVEEEPVDKASAAAGGFASGLLGGAVISGILCLVIACRYKGRRGEGEYAYQQNAKMNLTRQEDMFLNQTVTQRKIPKNPPPQSSSSGHSSAGRSSVHHSSSGSTHGGGGRKF